MNLSNYDDSHDYYLHSAKRLFKEEQSYPSVYRKLIQEITPDEAILILNELKSLSGDMTTEEIH